MTGGSFKTREFVHGASARAVRMARVGFQVLGFGFPPAARLGAAVRARRWPGCWRWPRRRPAGLLAERWSSSPRRAIRRTSTTRPCRDAGVALRALAETCAKIPCEHPTLRPAPVGAQGKPTLKDPQEIERISCCTSFSSRTSGLRGTDDITSGNSESPPRMEDPGVPRPHADASLKALAADAGIDVVVASRTVADMHSRGLVDKRRSRQQTPGVLRLTDDGVQIHGKAKLMAAAYNR